MGLSVQNRTSTTSYVASLPAIRDRVSYCGILLDDNNRKPICRLHFNSTQKYIGLFDKDRNEERVSIENLNDIYQYADRLRATISLYYEPTAPGNTDPA